MAANLNGTINVREFARNPSAVIKKVADSRDPVLLTRHGVPIVALVPLLDGHVDADAVALAASQVTVGPKGRGLLATTLRDLARAVEESDTP